MTCYHGGQNLKWNVPWEQTFDKISFRTRFEPDSQYLLLDGISCGAHGHSDANCLIRFTDNDRVWLVDDFIHGGPVPHRPQRGGRDPRRDRRQHAGLLAPRRRRRLRRHRPHPHHAARPLRRRLGAQRDLAQGELLRGARPDDGAHAGQLRLPLPVAHAWHRGPRWRHAGDPPGEADAGAPGRHVPRYRRRHRRDRDAGDRGLRRQVARLRLRGANRQHLQPGCLARPRGRPAVHLRRPLLRLEHRRAAQLRPDEAR